MLSRCVPNLIRPPVRLRVALRRLARPGARAALAGALLLAALAPPALTPLPASAGSARVSADGERLLDAQGRPRFVLAFNYEGPGDRAWQMWEDGRFDLALFDADFQRAASAGAQALRVFVQAPLQRDIAQGRWSKLDAVVGLAEQRGLQLIVSLHDYTDLDLQRVAAVGGQIAARYRGRPGILAYDLKNEPRFGDLALTRYAKPAPLQTRALVDAYGERLPRAELADFRASEAGAREVPASLTDEQAWLYVNNLRLYRELLAEAGEWVRTRGGTSIDYVRSPAGARWATFLGIFDDTLRAWLAPQVASIRAADPTKPITVAHVDALLALLTANRLLDYQTLHRYPSPTGASVRASLALAAQIQAAQPGQPFVLGEFGFANETLDPPRTALYETALYLGLLAQRAAGGAKWVLNDMPEGYNMRERTLGAFTLSGAPKPTALASAALRDYLAASGSPPGELQVQDDPEVGLRYVYRATDALFLGGKSVAGPGARLVAGGPAQVFLRWSEPGALAIWASGPLRVELSPGGPWGALADGAVARHTAEPGVAAQPTRTASGSLALDLPRAGPYRLPLKAPPPAGAEYDVPNGRFFTQTNGAPEGASKAGFRVTNDDGIPFWDAFRQLGGVDALGYPVTRRFPYDGFTVQAFQKAVLQWRPDQGGQVWLLNTFDALHDAGKDAWLEVYRQTPPPLDTAPDAGLAWEQVVARHLALLDGVPPALKERFLAAPEWLQLYGLPVSTREYPQSVVVRAQRATFQYWKVDVPWAAKGSISLANGGDLAKEAGLWPWLAATPENAPR